MKSRHLIIVFVLQFFGGECRLRQSFWSLFRLSQGQGNIKTNFKVNKLIDNKRKQVRKQVLNVTNYTDQNLFDKSPLSMQHY
jgi:hypothetical protein